jgi:hypothetical protein
MVHCQEQGVNPKTAEESDVREFVDRNLHKADTMVASLLLTVSVFYIWAYNRDYCETNQRRTSHWTPPTTITSIHRPHRKSRYSKSAAIRTTPSWPSNSKMYRKSSNILGRQLSGTKW